MFVRKKDNNKICLLVFVMTLCAVSAKKALLENKQVATPVQMRDTLASATSQANAQSVEIKDSSSTASANVSSQSVSQATALNGGQAKSDALSNSLGQALAVKNSNAAANSDSQATSNARTYGGNADSQADSKSVASVIANNSQSAINSASKVRSDATSIGDNFYLGNPVVTVYDNNSVGGPLMKKSQKEISSLLAQLNNDENNQIKTNDYINWEDVYSQTNADRYHHKKYANLNLINVDYEANTYLPSLSLPVQSQVSLTSTKFSSVFVKWTYTNFVGIDVAMDSQGNCIGAGLDGSVYEYNFSENSWAKIDGDFEMNSAMRVALGWEQTPFVVTSDGETFYQSSERKWEKLAGCARDIAVGLGAEVYKIGCERRPGGYRIYKLVCSYDKDKCKKSFRWRKRNQNSYTYEGDGKKCRWFNVNGSGVRIAVHPNGHPFIIDDSGAIQFYDGRDWHTIPSTSALDMAISNEGIVNYVGSDYGVYRLYPGKYAHDYTKVDYMKLLDRAAISIASGPYAEPIIVSGEYKVYTLAK